MPTAPDSQIPALPSEAIAHLHQGRFIEAVKVVRKVHGLQLKEAKDMVDAYIQSQPALQQTLSSKHTEAMGAFIRWLFIVGAFGAVAYFLAVVL